MAFITEKEMKRYSRMGLLLVFFPDNKHSLVSSPSSSSSTIRSTKSSSFLLSKAQSTISICVFLLFLTLFLFTLSTFEPATTTTTTTTAPTVISQTHRRFLLKRGVGTGFRESPAPPHPALQGMGTLFFRGTRAMHDLVVTHVGDDVAEDELRLFLRLLHRSGVMSKSDIVFLFGSSSSASRFDNLIREENDSFLRLVDMYQNSNSTNRVNPVLGFDVTRFVKHHDNKETGEPLWGKRSGGNRTGNESALNGTESTRLIHGSVMGFDATELDPENSLSGFLDHVSISLRRWACYPMLLGRVRHNFKHVMLVDAKNSLFLGDPLGRIRNHSPDSVLVFSKHSKRNSDRTQTISAVNSAVLMGGAKGIRKLSNAMLTEIVRASMQHKKKKNSVSEPAILNQLVGNMRITKNFEVIASTESIPETSSLTELMSRNLGPVASSFKDHDIIIRGNSNRGDINTVIMKQICSCEIDSSVYRDC